MVFIADRMKEEIIRHVQEHASREACGILAGKDGRVEKIFKMTNTADTPEKCYFMDSIEQLKVVKEIRKEELEMIGIYHSHPGSDAYPSARDVELAFYPAVAYIIVSLKNKQRPEIRAFRIVEGEIKEEEL